MTNSRPLLTCGQCGTPSRGRWLAAAIEKMRPWFVELGKPLPEVQVAVNGGAIHEDRSSRGTNSLGGLCSPPDETGAVQIIISPGFDSAMPRPQDSPFGVLEVLLHECVHAVVGAHVRVRLPWWAWLSLGAVPAWQWWKLRRQLRTVEHRVGVPLTIQTVRVW